MDFVAQVQHRAVLGGTHRRQGGVILALRYGGMVEEFKRGFGAVCREKKSYYLIDEIDLPEIGLQ